MSETNGKAGQIHKLIGEIMREIGHVGKERKASMGYSFRGIDDAFAAAQPLLGKHGVFVVPRVTDCQRTVTPKERGGSMTSTLVTVEHDVYAPDGSYVTVRMLGEAMDAGDKSASKAMSVAFREMIWKLFCVPTEDSGHDTEHEPLAPQQRAPYASKREDAPPPPKQPESPPADPLATAVGFKVAMSVAFKKRGFETADMIRAVAKIAEHFKVGDVGDVPVAERARTIAGVEKGNLDRFKAKPPTPAAPTNATPEQVTRVHELLARDTPRPPDGKVEELIGTAGVTEFEEMKYADIAAVIAYLENLQPAAAKAA